MFYKSIKKMLILFSLSFAIILTGCQTKQSYSFTFKIDAEDEIKVSLKNKDGYQLKQENGTFIVLKDNQKVSQGLFLKKEALEQYKKTITKSNKDILYLEEGEKDGNKYIYYETQGESGKEYNYLISVRMAYSGLILGCLTSKEAAQDAFNRLDIECEIYGV